MLHGHLDGRLILTQQDEWGDAACSLDQMSESLQVDVIKPLQQLANGDLTFDVTPHDQNDTLRHAIKKLGQDLNQMISDLQIAGQQIDQVIQQNTASAEESAATSEELSNQAAELKSQLGL